MQIKDLSNVYRDLFVSLKWRETKNGEGTGSSQSMVQVQLGSRATHVPVFVKLVHVQPPASLPAASDEEGSKSPV